MDKVNCIFPIKEFTLEIFKWVITFVTIIGTPHGYGIHTAYSRESIKSCIKSVFTPKVKKNVKVEEVEEGDLSFM